MTSPRTLQSAFDFEALPPAPRPPDPSLPGDITARRHGGNAESEAANRKVDKKEQRRVILELVQRAGEEGATLDEAAVFLRVAPNQISGRFTELLALKRIRRSGRRRPTRTGSPAAVYVAVWQ